MKILLHLRYFLPYFCFPFRVNTTLLTASPLNTRLNIVAKTKNSFVTASQKKIINHY